MATDGENGDGKSSAPKKNLDATAINRLTAAIDEEILPALSRLPIVGKSRDNAPDQNISSEDIQSLVTLLLSDGEYARTVEFLDKIRRKPVSVSAMFSDLLAPTAIRLGEMWDDDECSFVDVTIGVSQLQRLVREFGPLESLIVPRAGFNGSALFASTSGDQHTFGISVLGEAFRIAGWTVFEAPEHNRDDLNDILTRHRFDVVGFSLGSEDLAQALKDDVAIATSVIDRDKTLLVAGGAAFGLGSGVKSIFDVDAVIMDPGKAITRAENFLKERK